MDLRQVFDVKTQNLRGLYVAYSIILFLIINFFEISVGHVLWLLVSFGVIIYIFQEHEYSTLNHRKVIENELREIDPDQIYSYLSMDPNIIRILYTCREFRDYSPENYEKVLNSFDNYLKVASEFDYMSKAVQTNPGDGLERARNFALSGLNHFNSLFLTLNISKDVRKNSDMRLLFDEASHALRTEVRRGLIDIYTKALIIDSNLPSPMTPIRDLDVPRSFDEVFLDHTFRFFV